MFDNCGKMPLLTLVATCVMPTVKDSDAVYKEVSELLLVELTSSGAAHLRQEIRRLRNPQAAHISL